MKNNLCEMTPLETHISKMKACQILLVSDVVGMYKNEKVASRALSVEEKKGNLVRLCNGMYFRPKKTRFGVLYPMVDKILEAIERRDNVKIMPCGAAALNILGLSTQVPMKPVYLTTGSGRTLQIGKQKVKLLHSMPCNFIYRTKLATLLVQALKSLGEDNVTEYEAAIMRNLIHRESKQEDFVKDVAMMPKWMKKFVLANAMWLA